MSDIKLKEGKLFIGDKLITLEREIDKCLKAPDGYIVHYAKKRGVNSLSRNIVKLDSQGNIIWRIEEDPLAHLGKDDYENFEFVEGQLIAKTFSKKQEYIVDLKTGEVFPYSSDPRVRVEKNGTLFINNDPKPGRVVKFLITSIGVIVLTEFSSDQNIFMYDFDGNLKWTIEKCPHGDGAKPYTSISFDGNQNLQVYNWVGTEGKVDLKTGKVTWDYSKRPW